MIMSFWKHFKSFKKWTNEQMQWLHLQWLLLVYPKALFKHCFNAIQPMLCYHINLLWIFMNSFKNISNSFYRVFTHLINVYFSIVGFSKNDNFCFKNTFYIGKHIFSSIFPNKIWKVIKIQHPKESLIKSYPLLNSNDFKLQCQFMHLAIKLLCWS